MYAAEIYTYSEFHHRHAAITKASLLLKAHTMTRDATQTALRKSKVDGGLGLSARDARVVNNTLTAIQCGYHEKVDPLTVSAVVLQRMLSEEQYQDLTSTED